LPARLGRALLPMAVAGLAIAILSGCSSYNRQWRSALSQPLPSDGISGPWEGQWISDVNGHNGRLRCIMSPLGEGEYEARFHAKYRRVLSFSYDVPLHARKVAENRWEFDGEADLGKLAGGVYEYEGWATPIEFFSTYTSRHDHGRFEMKRPERP
jgi:hypothetical protein